MANNQEILLNTLKNDEYKPNAIKLYHITSDLKNISYQILVYLLSSIIIIITLPILRYFSLDNYALQLKTIELITTNEFLLFLFQLVLVSIGISKVFRFRDLRKQGMLIYERITDDIDWGKRRIEFINKPSEVFKDVIRRFLRTVDLPFTDSTTGEIIYIFLFLFCLFTNIILIYILS